MSESCFLLKLCRFQMVYNKTTSENSKNQCSASSFFYKWNSMATYTYIELLTWCNSKCMHGKLQKWQYGSPFFSHRFVLLHSLCYHEAELYITNTIWFSKCLFFPHVPDFLSLATRTSGSSNSSCSKSQYVDFFVIGGNFTLSSKIKINKIYVHFI